MEYFNKHYYVESLIVSNASYIPYSIQKQKSYGIDEGKERKKQVALTYRYK